MSTEIKGKLINVGDIQTFDSGFTKRQFVIETDEKYPQQIPFELFKDSCDLIDNYKLNEVVNVHYNLRGNEYNGKFYVNLNAWRVEKVEGDAKNMETDTSFEEPVLTKSTEEVDNDPNNLPF